MELYYIYQVCFMDSQSYTSYSYPYNQQNKDYSYQNTFNSTQQSLIHKFIQNHLQSTLQLFNNNFKAHQKQLAQIDLKIQNIYHIFSQLNENINKNLSNFNSNLQQNLSLNLNKLKEYIQNQIKQTNLTISEQQFQNEVTKKTLGNIQRGYKRMQESCGWKGMQGGDNNILQKRINKIQQQIGMLNRMKQQIKKQMLQRMKQKDSKGKFKLIIQKIEIHQKKEVIQYLHDNFYPDNAMLTIAQYLTFNTSPIPQQDYQADQSDQDYYVYYIDQLGYLMDQKQSYLIDNLGKLLQLNRYELQRLNKMQQNYDYI